MTVSRGRWSADVVQGVTGPRTSPANEGEECASMVRVPGGVCESGGKNRRLSLTVKHGNATSV